jgi:hypothetical protein
MIEDIDHLKSNSEIDSTVVYIDSSKRDRRFYPSSQEYTLSFDQPYKNVVGFDILDASIPTTMWNIDKYNDSIAITKASLPSTIISTTLSAMFFKEIANAKDFIPLFERVHDGNDLQENFVLIVDSQTLVDANISLSSYEVITTPFFIFSRSVINDVNIKQKPVNVDMDTFDFTFKDVLYYIEEPTGELVNIISSGNFYIELNDYDLYDVIYYTVYNVRSADYISLIEQKYFLLNIENYYKRLILGNYDIGTLKQSLNDMWSSAGISFSSTVQPDRKQGTYQVAALGYIIINAAIGRLVRQMGFDTYPQVSDSSKYAIISVGTNQQVFAALYIDDTSEYRIVAPGIVNLLGYRYIILRCKEIEDHLLGSTAYTNYSPGIGLFKLAAASSEVTHLRFDFVNLVRKPFHPIGKLSKLSIRFEIEDGLLYDFKGVNHQILLVLKFLIPRLQTRLPVSILNPNYNPNFIEYMATSRNIEYKEDSDDEQEFKDEQYELQYKKELQEFDYSSSDDEGRAEDDAEADDTNDSLDSEVEFDFSRR